MNISFSSHFVNSSTEEWLDEHENLGIKDVERRYERNVYIGRWRNTMSCVSLVSFLRFPGTNSNAR
jgi:hypothetical protein